MVVTMVPARRRTKRERSLWLLALLFGIAGMLHFVIPAPFIRIVPPWLSHAAVLVQVSGIAELLGALGLLMPRTRRAAGWGLIALLAAVFPANVQMLLLANAGGASFLWQSLLVARLPLQPLLAWWTWRLAVRARPSRTLAS